ncbi:MAG: hypothetical protein WCA45_13455, partial [Thiobacillaceae bacterium]
STMADPPVIERDFRYHDLSSEALSQHFFAMPATRCGLKVVPWVSDPILTADRVYPDILAGSWLALA